MTARWTSPPCFSRVGSETAAAIAPVVSAAARTRAQRLMLLPSEADKPFRGVYRQRGRGAEGGLLGSFKVKLVAYFVLLSLLPLAAAFWGFSTVAARADT